MNAFNPDINTRYSLFFNNSLKQFNIKTDISAQQAIVLNLNKKYDKTKYNKPEQLNEESLIITLTDNITQPKKEIEEDNKINTIVENKIEVIGSKVAVDIVPELNEDDVILLAKLIYGESRGNTNEAQQLVGMVVINRVNNPRFPNTIYDVIHAPGQYSVAKRLDSFTPTDKEINNARIVLSGQCECPDNVVYQSGFIQGSGIYKCINGEYFCFH